MLAELMTMLRLRLRSLLWRKRLDRDLEDEIRFHLEKKEEALRASGLDAAEAGHAARREFGNAVRIKETSRDQWTFPNLESVWQDFRFGARVLRRNKTFAAAGALSLALGIAANTSIFTLIDAVMIARLPVRNPDQLVVLSWAGPTYGVYMTNASSSKGNRMNVFSYAAFEQFRERAAQLERVFAFTPMHRTAVALRDRTELVQGLLVSGEFYEGIGVRPFLGRLLGESDDRRGAAAVAVLSHRFWRSAFGSDPRTVGSSVTVNGAPVIVAGVTPPGFYGPSAGSPVPSPDITLALAMQPEVDTTLGDGSVFLRPATFWLNVMGRLRPGATLARVEAELNSLFGPVNSAAGIGDPKVAALPGGRGLDNTRASLETPLTVLSVAGGLVLLVACANLATLLLARGTARASEVTVRLAIGAGRLRIMRQLFTESLLLSGFAAALGGLLSYWGSRALLRWLVEEPDAFPLSLAPNLRLIAFLGAVSALTVILFGLAPAFRASRGGGPGRGVHAGRFGQALIVVQVALSLVLLVGAGLFVRTLRNLRNVETGFNSRQVLVFNVDPSLHRYEGERLRRFHGALLSRLAAFRGVVSASAARLRLLSGGMSGSPAEVPGSASSPQVHVNDVGPGFFGTMGIPLLLGREIADRDNATAVKVAVINESMAKAAFAGEPPIGRTFSLFGGSGPYRVVGVVADALYDSLKQTPPPTAYIPYEQSRWQARGLYYLVRTAGSPEAFIPTVRSILRDLDPNIPISQVSTQQRVIDGQLRRERMLANLATCFGALALILAAIGIYGVIAYAAARRTAEIGVRTALGARTGDIVWLMLRSTALLSACGVACGMAGAKMLTKYLDATILFGVEPNDPASYIVGAGTLLGIALLAGFLPALRASRTDPIAALRCE